MQQLYTYFIVSLLDDMPETPGETKTVQLCQVNFDGPCSRSHFIQIKNCGTFFVYELTPLDICSSAYCFGKKENVLEIYHINVFKLIHA